MDYVNSDKISEEDAMALYLIEERANPESRFRTWFPLMPTEFESPPFFNQDELKLLKGDDIYQKAVNARRTYRRSFQRIQENTQEKMKYEDYVWAKHMIESRAWHLRGKQYLVPMADFFNHRPHPSVKYEDYVPDMRGEFFEKHHRVTDCCAEIVADRDAEKGSQVYETYGDNTNYIYFMYHGFIPDENPYECVDLDLPDLFYDLNNDDNDADKTELQLVRSNRIQVAKALGFRQPSLCVRDEVKMFEQIVSYMRARALDDSDSFKACRNAQDTYTAKSLRSCVPTFDATPLHNVLRKKLKKYKKRSKSLDDNTLNNRERWAIRYVDVRKGILKSLLDYIKTEVVTSMKSDL